MLWHGSVAGAFDLKTIVMESVTSMRRTGEYIPPVSVDNQFEISCNNRSRYHHFILYPTPASLVPRDCH